MNKVDIKREIKKRLEENNRYLYIKDINYIVDETFNIIQECLSNDEDVQIHGFGKFYTSDVRRYYGRDPQKPTNVIIVPAYKRVRFSSGKTFKSKINKGDDK